MVWRVLLAETFFLKKKAFAEKLKLFP